MKKLPHGWKIKNISEVLERLSPGPLRDTTSNQQSGTVPVVSQSENGFVGYHDGIAGVTASSDNPIVTFANHTCAVRWHEVPFSTIQNVFPLRGKQGVMETVFLYWMLKWAITPSFYGGHWPMLVEKVVPLPPIEEQRRIAASLKAQMAEVEKARKAAEAQIRDTKTLLSRHCESALNMLKDATRVQLGELLLRIEAGKSFKTTELPARSNELGVLKVSAVSWNQFQPQEAKAVAADYEPDEKHRVQKGDLIISRANTVELVGAIVRASKDYPLRLLSDKTLRLVVDKKKVDPDYLLNVLRWPEARAHIEHNATGTSDSMRNISQKTINRIPVPLVSKNFQHAIIQKLSAITDETVKIENAVNKSLTKHI